MPLRVRWPLLAQTRQFISDRSAKSLMIRSRLALATSQLTFAHGATPGEGAYVSLGDSSSPFGLLRMTNLDYATR